MSVDKPPRHETQWVLLNGKCVKFHRKDVVHTWSDSHVETTTLKYMDHVTRNNDNKIEWALSWAGGSKNISVLTEL